MFKSYETLCLGKYLHVQATGGGVQASALYGYQLCGCHLLAYCRRDCEGRCSATEPDLYASTPLVFERVNQRGLCFKGSIGPGAGLLLVAAVMTHSRLFVAWVS